MIVKFHATGTGRGSGPVEYLLGKDGQRDGATLDRGEPSTIMALIDSSPYAKKYTSGVLSFAESDLPREAKNKLMSSFESALLPGLDKDQFAFLWVEHRDKGRLELNFVVPNIELQSGKRLQPYFDRVDRPRINAWQTIQNEKLQLHDPNDPANKRELVTANNLPKSKVLAAEQITYGLLKLAESGEIRHREDVKTCLQKSGFTIARETPKSLSVADPDGGRNIRLKGMIYEQDFRFGSGLRNEIETASERYRTSSKERVQEARKTYHRGVEIKRAHNQQRHRQPEFKPAQAHTTNMVLDDIQHRFGADRLLGRDLVSGKTDHGEFNYHQPAERSDRVPGVQREQDSNQPMRQGESALCEDRSQRKDVREQSNQGISLDDSRGVLIDDRIREPTFDRLRAITERARQTTSRLCEGLQRISENVRDYFSRESGITAERQQLDRASAELERSAPAVGKAIQQEIVRDRQLGDREMSL